MIRPHPHLDFRRVWDAVLNLLYPPVCQLCRSEPARAAEGYVGRRCAGRIRPVRPPFCQRCGLPARGEITHTFTCANCVDLELAFETARAAVEAEGVALELIHQFKYGRALWFTPFMVDHLARMVGPAVIADPMAGLVPVPLHPLREREREYNQATRLARGLGHRLGLPVREHLVRRVAATPTQTRLSRAGRLANVRRAFAPVTGAHVDGGHWGVVDDVLTTGATCHAVAACLLELGADRVSVWSFARATLDDVPLG